MIYDKGEELVGKAKDLMQSLKARVSFSMSQKKANREQASNEEEESKKGWSA